MDVYTIKEIIMRISHLLFPLLLAVASPALHAEAAPAGTPPAGASAAATRVNVNAADVPALMTLKGVGEKKAQAIIAYRKSHGAFNSLEQFEAVPGIGPSIVAKNRAAIVFR